MNKLLPLIFSIAIIPILEITGTSLVYHVKDSYFIHFAVPNSGANKLTRVFSTARFLQQTVVLQRSVSGQSAICSQSSANTTARHRKLFH